MTSTLEKPDILQAIQDLEDDATIDDAIERLILLRKVQIGLRQVERGESASLAEVEARLRARRRA